MVQGSDFFQLNTVKEDADNCTLFQLSDTCINLEISLRTDLVHASKHLLKEQVYPNYCKHNPFKIIVQFYQHWLMLNERKGQKPHVQ